MEKTLKWAKRAELFKKLNFEGHEKEFHRLAEEGQTPKALFIGCSDSRVLPELFTHSKPGELFVVRNAGNFVPTWSPDIRWDGVAASILFAVEVLKVAEVIVCGHSTCGAIEGLYSEKGEEMHPYLKNWIRLGEKAKRLAEGAHPELIGKTELHDLTARLSVVLQLEHLLEYPAIQERVKEKKLYLHGWFYHIDTGELDYFDPEEEKFIPLKTLLKPCSDDS
ncbi:MAG: carbonic anhydrase [Chlamydiia bacterium]|nr:carbonic anhydrase [Chlamydiia bacterium]